MKRILFVKKLIDASKKKKSELIAHRIKLKDMLVQENSKMEKIGNISLENKIFYDKMNSLKNKAKNVYLSTKEKYNSALDKVVFSLSKYKN